MKEKRTSAAEAGCNGNTYGTGEITPASKEPLLGTPITRALNETRTFQGPSFKAETLLSNSRSNPEPHAARIKRVMNHAHHEPDW
jgi:hypothetical protein